MKLFIQERLLDRTSFLSHTCTYGQLWLQVHKVINKRFTIDNLYMYNNKF